MVQQVHTTGGYIRWIHSGSNMPAEAAQHSPTDSTTTALLPLPSMHCCTAAVLKRATLQLQQLGSKQQTQLTGCALAVLL